MAYSKFVSLFGGHTLYFKDGGMIASRPRGGVIEFTQKALASHVKITRSQAFRYWDKHFPGRFADDLPAPIEEATCLDPREEADFAVDAVTCEKVWR